MFLFFLLIQDTCPFFWGMCDILGLLSQHVTGHLLLMLSNRACPVGAGQLDPPHTHKKTWAAEYTKFEESEVSQI